MPFLLAEILNFQGSAHHVGVGSLSYLIDEKYFFDSAYHLNDEGVQIRTRQLIEDIKSWIKVIN